MAAQDHRYNNPVLIVFLQLLQESLHEGRLQGARMKFKREPQRRLFMKAARASVTERGPLTLGAPEPPSTNCLTMCVGGPKPDDSLKQPLNEPLSAFFTNELEAGWDKNRALTQESGDAVAQLRRRKRLAKNKWQLARMLLVNPVLQKYRKHRLTTEGLDALELSSSSNPLERMTKMMKAAKLVGDRWHKSAVGSHVDGAVRTCGIVIGKQGDKVADVMGPVVGSPIKAAGSKAAQAFKTTGSVITKQGDKVADGMSQPLLAAGDAVSSTGSKTAQAFKNTGSAIGKQGEKVSDSVGGLLHRRNKTEDGGKEA